MPIPSSQVFFKIYCNSCIWGICTKYLRQTVLFGVDKADLYYLEGWGLRNFMFFYICTFRRMKFVHVLINPVQSPEAWKIFNISWNQLIWKLISFPVVWLKHQWFDRHKDRYLSLWGNFASLRKKKSLFFNRLNWDFFKNLNVLASQSL